MSDTSLKLMSIWQYAWLHMADAWWKAVEKRFGTEAAVACNDEAWVTVGERVNPRYAKVANIELNTVLDSLKCLQLPLDNTMGGLYPAKCEIKSPNHVIWTITQCRSLLHYESKAPALIEPVCYGLEKKMIEKYLINPKIKVTALKLPPRNSPDDIACQWEFKLEDN